MLRVSLYVRVENGLPSGHVVDLEVPPFSRWPDVIQWGARVFVLHNRETGSYVEGLAWCAPPMSELGRATDAWSRLDLPDVP